jgi:3-carboxy-cis,cis-muconate cycloisomerase
MQPASITSFGLLCSQWAAPLVRDQQRLCAASANATALRLANDLVATADMQDQHMQVMAMMAADLQLQDPTFAGNTAHDEVVALACALGLLAGNLGHIAARISHMVAFEVGELMPAAASGALAPGATAMQSPPMTVMCMTALAHAHRVPQQVAVLLATLPQERTNLPGHWQAQLAQWPALLTASQSITSTLAQLVTSMQPDTQRMRSNLDAVRASLPAKEIKARFSNDLLKHASRLTHTQIKVLRIPPGV